MGWLLERYLWLLDELDLVLAQISSAIAEDAPAADAERAERLAGRAVRLLVVLGGHRDVAYVVAAEHDLNRPNLVDLLDPAQWLTLDDDGPLRRVVLHDLLDSSPGTPVQTLSELFRAGRLNPLISQARVAPAAHRAAAHCPEQAGRPDPARRTVDRCGRAGRAARGRAAVRRPDVRAVR